MERVLKISSNLDQLTHSELQRFMNAMYKRHNNKKLIIKAFTHLMIDEIQNNRTSNYIDDMSIISNQILNDRINDNKQTSTKVVTNRICFNKLPSEIISNICSYLTNVCSFQLVNKFIYISCSSMQNSFTSVSLNVKMINKHFTQYGHYFCQYKVNTLKKLRNIHSLNLVISKYMVLKRKFPKLWVWTKLQQLNLNYSRCNYTYLQNFFEEHCSVIKQMEILEIKLVNLPKTLMGIQSIYMCKNIKSLTLENMMTPMETRPISPQHDYQSPLFIPFIQFKTLKKLCLINVYSFIFNGILVKIGHQIEDFESNFTCHSDVPTAWFHPHVKVAWTSLKKITIWITDKYVDHNYEQENINTIQQIIKKAPRLESIKFLLTQKYSNKTTIIDKKQWWKSILKMQTLRKEISLFIDMRNIIDLSLMNHLSLRLALQECQNEAVSSDWKFLNIHWFKHWQFQRYHPMDTMCYAKQVTKNFIIWFDIDVLSSCSFETKSIIHDLFYGLHLNCIWFGSYSFDNETLNSCDHF